MTTPPLPEAPPGPRAAGTLMRLPPADTPGRHNPSAPDRTLRPCASTPPRATIDVPRAASLTADVLVHASGAEHAFLPPHGADQEWHDITAAPFRDEVRPPRRDCSRPASAPATGWVCCHAPGTSGRWSTMRAGGSAPRRFRSTRARPPTRSGPCPLADSGAVGLRGRDGRAGGSLAAGGVPATIRVAARVGTATTTASYSQIRPLAGTYGRRQRARGETCGGDAGRSCDRDLHIGDDRPSQGMLPHARQLHGRAGGGHGCAAPSCSTPPDNARRCSSCRWRMSSPGSSRWVASTRSGTPLGHSADIAVA